MRFNGKWRDTGQFVYPLSMSSSVTFPEVGVWTAPDGREHPIDMTLGIVDWNGFWKNVLCRSLLWFWIPVHTVTFLLPPSFRVLFAAVLGAILGLLLALLSSKQTEAA